jgi:hypothetical protein
LYKNEELKKLFMTVRRYKNGTKQSIRASFRRFGLQGATATAKAATLSNQRSHSGPIQIAIRDCRYQKPELTRIIYLRSLSREPDSAEQAKIHELLGPVEVLNRLAVTVAMPISHS